MTAPAPVSVCLIVKNESGQLEGCLRSLRPYVAEIVVVDTGSTDNTPEIAKKFADRFEVFTACNDSSGRIESFSMARQRSFELATQPWVMWVDGDDEVVGADKLEVLIKEYDKIRDGRPAIALFPYEYAHDSQGNVICLHYRERLVSPKSAFKWIGPVHEVLSAESSGTVQIQTDVMKFIHRRESSKKVTEPDRNLRILEANYAKAGETEPRQLYYLGLEYGYRGDFDNAIKFHKRYIELSSWDDEKFLACLKIAEHYQVTCAYEMAIDWGLKAMTIREGWAEAYFSIGRSFYFMAQRSGPNERRNWEKAAYYLKAGLALPETKTVLFLNPIERTYDVHKFLNLALNKIGDVAGALESANKGLEVCPEDEGLLTNKRLYEEFLNKQKLSSELSKLVQSCGISAEAQQLIIDIMGGKPVNVAPAVTVNCKGYHLPDSVDLDSKPSELDHGLMLSMIKLLWKQLLLHDEVMNARNILISAPWQIRSNPEVKKMLSLTDVMLSHLKDDSKFISMYNGGSDQEAIPLPLPIRPPHGQFARFNYLLELLEKVQKSHEGKLKVLDIGCMDGWITNRIGLLGYSAWGMDASPNSIGIANRKALEFSTGAKHASGLFGIDKLPAEFPQKFDVISLFEIYEHVENPLSLLKEASKLLSPGGHLVVSTPRGSWCQGVDVPFHKPWNDPNPREHIRAPILSEVISDLESVGLKSVSGSEILIDQSEQPIPIITQATICVHGISPKILPINKQTAVEEKVYKEEKITQSANKPFNKKNLDLIFYVGQGPERWNPETARRGGIGGSETAVIEMCKRLSGLGHKVRVYGDCGEGLSGCFDGVYYTDHSNFKNLECDVLITSRKPEAVDEIYNVKRRATFCWIHDVHCGSSLTHERALKIDKFLVLSDWHRANVLNAYQYVHPSQVVKTRNGIDLNRFNKNIQRNPHRAVYSSSPDRGMEVAVRTWPRVRAQIPDAELHIFYGFQNWEACADDSHLRLIQALKQLLKDHEKYGVFSHGRVPQDRLAEEYLKSGVWAYPTWFYETSCISAMEAHAAGLRMVTSPIAALNETVGDRGRLINGDWLSQSYQDEFVASVIEAMKKTDESDRNFLQSYANLNFGWDSLSIEWDLMFRSVLDSNQVMPLYKGFM